MADYDSLKTLAFQANMQVQAAGLVVLTWGNASAADHDAGVFAIKPSGVAYADLTPESMVIVRITDGTVVQGDHRPSSDTDTHQRLYAAFPGIGGVVHTHSVYATSFAQAARSIPCMGTTHADHFAGSVPVGRHPTTEEIESHYEAATGDIIVEHFRTHGIDPLHIPAILLPHHGPFTWGSSWSEAVKNAVALEAVAQMAMQAITISGGNPPAIPPSLQEKHFTRKHGPDAYYGQPGK